MGAHTNRRLETRQVLDSLRRIVQALRESSRHAERSVGVTGAQLFVLEKLAESPAQSLNELADRTHTHQSSVSTVVARLIEHGYVVRAWAADDGRRMELTLADRGRQLLAGAPTAAQDRLIRSIQRLPAQTRRQLASILSEVVDGMGRGRGAPRMFFDDEPRKVRRRHE
jgi:DNA-binding MarR family transcriptional regulator